MYRIPKEIDSELKINKALFLFDLLFMIGMLILTMIFNNFIHPNLQIVYYIFMGLVTVSMICRPPTNPKKRMYEVLVITMFRKRGIYHAIDRDFN
ncbi:MULTISPECIES: DUF5592 family protein [Bacillaceae]|uniref:Uncharacterized protein n=1 Tax=Domibacillus aminovorans TaxID=29332 RepID=A0A177L1M2_9BACI|nr:MULTISPECIES: DUF5592 family protein [Bacillaceae]OAH58671.1 hypothetical protein AWH48_16880 [Domibacillus aminovorans]